jgi:hypothetical protein
MKIFETGESERVPGGVLRVAVVKRKVQELDQAGIWCHD